MNKIHKAGALIFKNKKMLIAKSQGKPYYITPGGKYESGENAEECLRRELKEELDANLLSFQHYKTYNFEKAAHSDLPLCIELYRVEITGEPKVSSEIESLAWMSQEDFRNRKYNVAQSFDTFMSDFVKDNLL